MIIKIQKPNNISKLELKQIAQQLKINNYAIYDIGSGLSVDQSKNFIQKLASFFSLKNIDSNLCADSDSISSITVNQSKSRYIPYSSKAINWHTDGYYNSDNQQIKCFILHCVQPAAVGGVNRIINHEVIYQYLKQQQPEYLKALMNKNALTIPANEIKGRQIRKQQGGAVFSFDQDKKLHMRYSARGKNIIWHKNAQDAADFVKNLLDQVNLYQEIKLKSGNGIIANNVLHSRTKFTDQAGAKRHLLRARFYQRAILQNSNG